MYEKRFLYLSVTVLAILATMFTLNITDPTYINSDEEFSKMYYYNKSGPYSGYLERTQRMIDNERYSASAYVEDLETNSEYVLNVTYTGNYLSSNRHGIYYEFIDNTVNEQIYIYYPMVTINNEIESNTVLPINDHVYIMFLNVDEESCMYISTDRCYTFPTHDNESSALNSFDVTTGFNPVDMSEIYAGYTIGEIRNSNWTFCYSLSMNDSAADNGYTRDDVYTAYSDIYDLVIGRY